MLCCLRAVLVEEVGASKTAGSRLRKHGRRRQGGQDARDDLIYFGEGWTVDGCTRGRAIAGGGRRLQGR